MRAERKRVAYFMLYELIYTSTPRGLLPGSQGFCTVAMTKGIPAALITRLEGMTGYKPLYPPQHAKASHNPIAWCHVRIGVGSQMLHVLGRISPCGVDYTDRPNKLADLVVLSDEPLADVGPAALLQAPGFLRDRWEETPRYLDQHRGLPQAAAETGPCRHWKKAAGDAGWAGVLAEHFLEKSNVPMYVLYPAGVDPLPLIADGLRLLPASERWNVHFTTHAMSLPPEAFCHWRFIAAEAPEAESIAKGRFPVIALNAKLKPADGGVLVAAARSGFMPKLAPPPSDDLESDGFEVVSDPESRPAQKLPSQSRKKAPVRLDDLVSTEPEAPVVFKSVKKQPAKKSGPLAFFCLACGIVLGLGAFLVLEAILGRGLLPQSQKPERVAPEERALHAKSNVVEVVPSEFQAKFDLLTIEKNDLLRDHEALAAKHKVLSEKNLEEEVRKLNSTIGRLTDEKNKSDRDLQQSRLELKNEKKHAANKEGTGAPPIPPKISEDERRTAKYYRELTPNIDDPRKESTQGKMSLKDLDLEFAADDSVELKLIGLDPKAGDVALKAIYEKDRNNRLRVEFGTEDPQTMISFIVEGVHLKFEWKKMVGKDDNEDVTEAVKKIKRSVLKIEDKSKNFARFIVIGQPATIQMKQPEAKRPEIKKENDSHRMSKGWTILGEVVGLESPTPTLALDKFYAELRLRQGDPKIQDSAVRFTPKNSDSKHLIHFDFIKDGRSGKKEKAEKPDELFKGTTKLELLKIQKNYSVKFAVEVFGPLKKKPKELSKEDETDPKKKKEHDEQETAFNNPPQPAMSEPPSLEQVQIVFPILDQGKEVLAVVAEMRRASK